MEFFTRVPPSERLKQAKLIQFKKFKFKKSGMAQGEHSQSVPDPFAAYAAFAFGRLNILLFSSLRTKKCANDVRKHSVNKTIYKN